MRFIKLKEILYLIFLIFSSVAVGDDRYEPKQPSNNDATQSKLFKLLYFKTKFNILFLNKKSLS